MRRLLVFSLFAALPSFLVPSNLAAQRAGFAHFSGRSFSQSGSGRSFSGRSSSWGFCSGESGAACNAHVGRDGFGWGAYYPAFLDDYYSDSDRGAQYPESSQPPVIVLPAVPPSSAASGAGPPSPAQSLLIELQGNSYVQVSGNSSSPAQLLDQSGNDKEDNKTKDARNRQGLPPPIQPSPQPAVLVFRDGHRQEVSDFTIADGFLYASSDYYRSGSWNQKIELAVLDLDETVQANQTRGVPFRLPSAPNVVIVGP
jgi:hypothetical protein